MVEVVKTDGLALRDALRLEPSAAQSFERSGVAP
jgi:hypothetical protein